MLMDRRQALVLGTAAAALGLTRGLGAQTLAPVRVGVALNDPYMEPLYARDRGFFAKAGVAVDIQPLANGGRILQGVAAGALDVGVGELTQVANAIEKGVPLAVFAGGAVHRPEEPTLILCVAKNSRIRTAKDLEGQTVAVSTLNSLPAAATMLWLESGGANLASVKLFEMPLGEMGPAMARGTVAAALLGEPFIADNKDTIARLAVPFDSVGRSFYIGCWYAQRDWLTKNADTARRFASAIYAAGDWANKNRSDSAAIEATYVKLDVERLRAMPRNSFSLALDPKLMQPVLDLGVRYKMLPSPISAADAVVVLGAPRS
jgi:NitT/TauT family transport system substrate-binding protein